MLEWWLGLFFVTLLAMGWWPCRECCRRYPATDSPCDNCTDGVGPYQYSVYIPALADTYLCSDCASFAGTYVLTSTDAECAYSTGYLANPTTCTLTPANPYMALGLVIGSSSVLLSLGIYTSALTKTIVSEWSRSITTPVDCDFSSLAMSGSTTLVCDPSSIPSDAVVDAL